MTAASWVCLIFANVAAHHVLLASCMDSILCPKRCRITLCSLYGCFVYFSCDLFTQYLHFVYRFLFIKTSQCLLEWNIVRCGGCSRCSGVTCRSHFQGRGLEVANINRMAKWKWVSRGLYARYGREKRCLQRFGVETWGKETTETYI